MRTQNNDNLAPITPEPINRQNLFNQIKIGDFAYFSNAFAQPDSGVILINPCFGLLVGTVEDKFIVLDTQQAEEHHFKYAVKDVLNQDPIFNVLPNGQIVPIEPIFIVENNTPIEEEPVFMPDAPNLIIGHIYAFTTTPSLNQDAYVHGVLESIEPTFFVARLMNDELKHFQFIIKISDLNANRFNKLIFAAGSPPANTPQTPPRQTGTITQNQPRGIQSEDKVLCYVGTRQIRTYGDFIESLQNERLRWKVFSFVSVNNDSIIVKDQDNVEVSSKIFIPIEMVNRLDLKLTFKHLLSVSGDRIYPPFLVNPI